MKVPNSAKATVFFVTEKDNFKLIRESSGALKRLGNASDVVVTDDVKAAPADSVSVIIPGANLYIPLTELIDVDKEIERLTAELAKIESEIERVSAKLANENFVTKAPARLIDAEREKAARFASLKEETVTQLDKIKNLKK